jgi:diacylglycerol kinase (ATP)
MNQITENIYLGSSASARDKNEIKQNGITAILNVAFDLADVFSWNDKLIIAHCGLIDGPGNPLSFYHAGLSMLKGLLEQGHKVLVHCHMGRSRSAFIVVAHLTQIDPEQRGYDFWHNYVKSRRPQIDIHPIHKALMF